MARLAIVAVLALLFPAIAYAQETDDDVAALVARPASENAQERAEASRALRRMGAAEGLGGIGPAARDAVPALIAALGDEDTCVRMYAASALGWIGPAAKAAVPTLVALLEDVHVRGCAVFALGRVGPAAREAIPALEALAHDGARDAEFALGCIRGAS